MLHKIYKLNLNFNKNFKNYDFHNLYKELLNFCTVDLSAFYFDIRKDTLYCDEVGSEKRKACITILNIILNLLIRWFAPILSFTTEEIYQLIFKDNKSVHLKNFLIIPENFKNEKLNNKWEIIRNIRKVVTGALEKKREERIIGSSLEASIEIYVDKKIKPIIEDIDFAEISITSNAKLLEKNSSTKGFILENYKDIIVNIKKADGKKCNRCWKISEEVKNDNDICNRCDHIIKNKNF